MLTEQDKRAIKALVKKRDDAYKKAFKVNDDLRRKIFLTRRSTGCTLEELGEVVGVSRQRIHQILRGE